jgi:hypothetical protein
VELLSLLPKVPNNLVALAVVYLEQVKLQPHLKRVWVVKPFKLLVLVLQEEQLEVLEKVKVDRQNEQVQPHLVAQLAQCLVLLLSSAGLESLSLQLR